MKLSVGPYPPEPPTGWVSHRFLEAHGITADIIRSWGGEVVDSWCRPEQCLILIGKETSSDVTAAVHEAIMKPWWTNLIDGPRKFIPISAEPEAQEKLHEDEAAGPCHSAAGVLGLAE